MIWQFPEKKLSTSRPWHVWIRPAAFSTVWPMTCRRKNAFHEDEVIQEFTPDELIEPNAPDFQCGGVAVPRVVE